jgi:SAM-dependent methyltransferase
MAQSPLKEDADTLVLDIDELSQFSELPDLSLTASFSTTESIPSDTFVAAAEPVHKSSSSPEGDEVTAKLSAKSPNVTMPTRYIPTVSAYNAWASVYDTDGNILQAIDDLDLETMLPSFISNVLSSTTEPKKLLHRSLSILDIGCGTARNTLKILRHQWPENTNVKLVGVDASTNMLALAEEKLRTASKEQVAAGRSNIPEFQLLEHDFLNPENARNAPILPAQWTKAAQANDEADLTFDAVISTLVLEHFPLNTFFSLVRTLSRPGGFVLLTNMHPDMGARSQAGFVETDQQGRRVKVRGNSWVHGVVETVDEANTQGFDVVGSVRETEVKEGMIEMLGERGRKWVGTSVWYGMVLRRREK